MRHQRDSANEFIQGTDLKLNLENIAINAEVPIKIFLADWKHGGLKIAFSIEGFGKSYYNDVPYDSRENAIIAYKSLTENIQKGNYSIEINGYNKMKLNLRFGEFE